MDVTQDSLPHAQTQVSAWFPFNKRCDAEGKTLKIIISYTSVRNPRQELK